MTRLIHLLAFTALAVLCVTTSAQEDTADDWLNRGDESREMAINETQNETAREIYLQESLEAYKKATEINPQSASAWFKIGKLQIDFLGNFDEALNAFNRSTEIDPQSADAWYLRGKT